MQSWIKWIVAVAAVCALAAPAGAAAATVVNGDFETGNLDGWQQYNKELAGEWFTYSREDAEPSPGVFNYFPPPSGNFAAREDQGDPDIDALYQDVALEPGLTHHLSLTFYYFSEAPIVVPSPDTLSLETENQQVRVDVMKPSAPIESVSPADILTTLYASESGDSEVLEPVRLTADLTPFAGRTVRLRIVSSVTNSPMEAGVDDVSIASASPAPPLPSPPAPPSNAITRGKLTLNKKTGTAKLAVVLPGPGTLTEIGKGKRNKVKGATLTATAAGTVQVPLKPTALGRKALKTKGKLKTGIEVNFTPTGGTAGIQSYKVTLKKTLKP